MTDKEIIDGIIQREGSAYTNTPGDKGGATKYGITQATLKAWRKAAVSETDVQLLTEEEARAIYQHRYIIDPGFSHIADDALRVAVIDAGVNSGTGTATLWLQRALGMTADGLVGVKTLGALDHSNAYKVLARFTAQRVKFLGRVITDRPDQSKFAAGWLSRAVSFLES